MCDLAIPFPKGSERYPKYPLPPEVKIGPGGLPEGTLRRPACSARYRVDFAAVGRPGGRRQTRAARASAGRRKAAAARLLGVDARAGAGRAPGLRAGDHHRHRLHRLLPRRLGLHPLGQVARRFPSAPAAVRAPAASSPTCSASPISIRCGSSSCSSASSTRSASRRRTSTSISACGGAARSSTTSARSTARLRRQHHHLRHARRQDGDPRRLAGAQPAVRRGRPAGEDDPGRAQHHPRATRSPSPPSSATRSRAIPWPKRSSTRRWCSKGWCATPASTPPASSSPTSRSMNSCR